MTLYVFPTNNRFVCEMTFCLVCSKVYQQFERFGTTFSIVREMDKMNPKAEDDNDGSASSDHETDTNADTNLSDAPDTNYTDANSEVHQAFKGDDRGVFCWRIVVKLIMIFIATLVTTMTYKELSKSERNDFEASVSTFLFTRCVIHKK